MAMIDLPQDISGKKATRGRFDPFPAGEYVMEVAKLPSKEKGRKAPYVKWFFKVVEDAEYEGRWVKHMTSLMNDEEVLLMEGGIKDTLDCLGVPLQGRGFDGTATVGRRVVADVVQETYQPEGGEERVQMTIDKLYPYEE